MRSFDSETETLFAGRRYAVRTMIAIDLPSGVYGFWTGNYDFTWAQLPGVTFRPHNSVIQIEDAEETNQLESHEATLTVRAVPETDLTPDVLATFDDEQYKHRPVTTFFAVFDPDTRALASVEVDRYYTIDNAELVEDENESKLVINLETDDRDLTSISHRTSSHADQHLIDANDNALQHVGTLNKPIYWNRRPPK